MLVVEAPSYPFFSRSKPLPCPYILNQIETCLITKIEAKDFELGLFSELIGRGFRRNYDYLYRPDCISCQACVPIRIPVASFKPRASFLRILYRNKDLQSAIVLANASNEHYLLFISYQRSRHGDGNMVEMSYSDFAAYVAGGAQESALFEIRNSDGVLLGVSIIDILSDGFSANYSYFAPREPKRSLGTLLILLLVSEAKLQKLDFLYLGYWIKDCRKMAYKIRFQPNELWDGIAWRSLLST